MSFIMRVRSEKSIKKEYNIEKINILDERYPKRLRKIYDPPINIYVKGNSEILNGEIIAIIGSNEPSFYGEYISKHFSDNLSKNGVIITNGLSKGIEQCANIACLQCNGKIIGVLQTGFDIKHSEEVEKNFRDILDNGGCIVSEYLNGGIPLRSNIIARNRIISGISAGILLVESKYKSEQLIAVDFAIEQGKEIFVVPGNITSKNSIANNQLIKDGATITTNYNEIIDYIRKTPYI